MKDFLGNVLQVDDMVLMVKTPVDHEYRYKLGKIQSIQGDKIFVSYHSRRDFWTFHGPNYGSYFKPKQLVKMNHEDIKR